MDFGVERRKYNNHGVLSKPHDKHKSSFNSKRPSYFCDHCEINGHSKHSYSTIHAAAASTNCHSSSQDGSSFGLSHEQFSNLLNFFGKANVIVDKQHVECLDNDSYA